MGLYAGNWEYVTDEEKVPEYLTVAEKIAGVEGRTTRRAFAKLTSKESARDSGKLLRSSFENQLRKSGRARNHAQYVGPSASEDNAHESAAAEQTQQSGVSPIQETKQTSPSTSASSTTNRSTLMPDDHSRSTSTSTATNAEQHERPKLSWNAIVYEVLATAEGPLAFTQLMQGIKKRFPFFNSSSQDKVLKSGLKNPLYFHEAFVKGEIVDGKQTWGLRPGRFVDKKTGEVLTPEPLHPIYPPGHNEEMQEVQAAQEVQEVPEMEESSPDNSTSKVSQPHRPRSSNPRFGREILNSPEIPDSQNAIPTTSSPRGADSRIVGENTPDNEERTGAQEDADAANESSAKTSPETTLSPQLRLQWAGTTGSLLNPTSTNSTQIAATAEDKSTRESISTIDGEASTKAAQSVSPLQAPHQPVPFIPPSPETGHQSESTISQIAFTPISLANLESPTHVPTLRGDGAAKSQTSDIVPAPTTPLATPLPSAHLYVIPSPLKPSNLSNLSHWPMRLIVPICCRTARPEPRKTHMGSCIDGGEPLVVLNSRVRRR